VVGELYDQRQLDLVEPEEERLGVLVLDHYG
jgi:hypothetical protein